MKDILLFFLGILTMNMSILNKSYGQAVPDYAPGSLIIKFTQEAVDHPDFQLQISQGTFTT